MSANPLAPSSTPTSLPELMQANVVGGNTCRVGIVTPLGRGTIHVLEGKIVDASHGDLSGPDAFHSLLASEPTSIVVETGRTTSRRTIATDWWKLLFETMRLKEEGRIPVPRMAAAPPVQETPTATPSSRRFPWIVLVLVLLLGVALGIVLLKRSPAREVPAAGPAPSRGTAIEPLEASELTGTGDAAPQVAHVTMPASPDPSMALKPEIVCRVLVDENGRVVEAKIYRSRLDLAAFEESALAAVKTWSFTPARKANAPVPAWVNVSVSFL